MPRSIRLEYPGAYYHVMARGNRRNLLDYIDLNSVRARLIKPRTGQSVLDYPCIRSEQQNSNRQMKREATNAKSSANSQSKKKGRPFIPAKPSDTGDTLQDVVNDCITVHKTAFTATSSPHRRN